MGGLPTPRPDCEVIETPDGLRVVEKKNHDKDHTDAYNKGANEVWEMAKRFNVKKAFLLENCPMCGPKIPNKQHGILARLLEEKGIQVRRIPPKRKPKAGSQTKNTIR